MSPLRILGTTPVLAPSLHFMPPAQAAPPQPIVIPVMQNDLADVPGKELVMLTVEYPPGSVEHVHRHDAPSSTCWKGQSSRKLEEARR
jgi:hypothetical protein